MKLPNIRHEDFCRSYALVPNGTMTCIGGFATSSPGKSQARFGKTGLRASRVSSRHRPRLVTT